MRSYLALALLAGLTSACNKTKTEDTGEPVAINNPPVAEAGNSFTQSADGAVPLSGVQSSDPDGDALTWHWAFDYVPPTSALGSREAPFSANDSASAVNTTFMPDATGTYVIKLTVKDARGATSNPDYVIVTVEQPDNIPVANAGPDVTANVGETVRLDGSRSYDPLGRAVTYNWVLVERPASSAASLVDSESVSPSIVPDVKGVYVANLVISNGLAPSNADAVTITAVADDNAPVANAGRDQTGEDCTNILLDCSASADPDGDALTYQWELQTKPTGSNATNASFSDRTAARPTFFPDVAGNYVVSCTVNDGTNWSTPDTMALAVSERSANTRPDVSAGTALTVDAGTAVCEEDGYTYDCKDCTDPTVTLGADATAVDPDGDAVSILWTVTSGNATITDATSLVTTVTLKDAAPTEPGECESTEYEFTLTATDCTGASTTARVTHTVSCCGVADTSAR
jgi:hypothetical protein